MHRGMHVLRAGFLLALMTVVLAENKYGDHGVVLTGLPFTTDGFDNILTYSENFAEFGKSEIGTYSTGNPQVSFTSCAVDYDMNYLYLYDYEARNIHLMENFNTSLIESELVLSTQHYGVAREHNKVVVDWISHNIYWTDGLHSWIAMQPGGPINDPYLYTVLVDKDLVLPRGLDIDPEEGFIFWTDAAAPAIGRASLTGQNPKILLKNNLHRPIAVTADHSSTTLYFAHRNEIEAIDYDGTAASRRHIVSLSSGTFYDMAIFQNVLLAIDVSEYYLHFFDKGTGDQLYDKYGSATEAFFGICLYHSEVQTTPALQDQCQNKNCDHMCVNEPSKATCLCRDGFKLAADEVTCNEFGGGQSSRALVLSTENKLCLLDIRILGKQHEDYTNAMCFYEGATGDIITHMDLNMRSREVYFTVGSIIYSIPIGGDISQRRNVTQQTKDIVGISYDWVNDNIYFAMKPGNDDTVESIWTVQPGTNLVKEHRTNTSGEVRALVTVPHENRTFWIAGDSLIEYADMAISNVSDIKILDADAFFLHATRMVHDVKYEVLHILDGDYGDISSVHYNGSYDRNAYLAPNAQDFAVYKEFIMYIEHQPTANKTVLKSANFFAGSPIQWMDFGELENVGKVYNVKILDLNVLQPEYKSPCINHNGGCEHLCYPEGSEPRCECQLGYKLNTTDGKSCLPSKPPPMDNFMLISDVSNNEVYAVDLASPDQVIGLVSSRDGTPHGVTYDPTNKTIYWSSYDYGEIWKKSLDGPEKSLFLNTGFNFGYPRRLVRDPNSGYIYYTSESLFGSTDYDSYIGVVNGDGTSQGFVIREGHIPSALAIHPAAGWIFWTDYGDFPSVSRADLDGQNSMVLIEEDVLLPNGVSIDNKGAGRLYWTDGFYNKVYSCAFDGSDRATLLEDKRAHLMDLVFLDDYIYYSSWNYPHITKVNVYDIMDRTELLVGTGVGRMTALFIYSSTATQISVTTVCNEGNHMCSHFCFPTPTGYGCGCEENIDLLIDGRSCENAPRCPLYPGEAEVHEDTNTCLRLAGNTCNFTCFEGHRRRSDSLITCTQEMGEDGQLMWDQGELCEEILCPIDIPHGALHENCSLQIGTDCVDYDCDPGYEKNPDVTELICDSDGTWTITDALCIAKCPPITSATERAQFVGTCDRNIGDTCRFVCDERYTYISNISSLTCQTGSTWHANTQLLCQDILCPDTIADGVIISCSRLIDSVCSYRCDDLFDPHASVRNVTCRSNGQWNRGSAVDKLCFGRPAKVETDTSKIVGIAVGVGVGVLLIVILVIVIVVFLLRRGSSTYGPSGSSNKSQPPVSFENPRYANSTETGEASGEQNKDFGYITLEEEHKI